MRFPGDVRRSMAAAFLLLVLWPMASLAQEPPAGRFDVIGRLHTPSSTAVMTRSIDAQYSLTSVKGWLG